MGEANPVVAIVVQLEDGRQLTITGRPAWALDALIRAGERGCTPLEHVGPRWSDYIFKLKKLFGLEIETVHEGHRGAFPGRHGRYVLRTPLTVLTVVRKEAERHAA